MAEDQYGYQATGEYAAPYEAALRRLQGQFARRRGELAQSVASRGVRTSGVSYIPEETLGRGEAEAEAGLIGDYSLQNIASREREREAALQRAHELSLTERGYGLQEAMQRRLGKSQLGGQLIGGGIGAIGQYFSGGYKG